MLGYDTEALGIEVGKRQMMDLAFVLQVGEMAESVKVAPVGVIPPMKLQQIEALDTHSRERNRDRVLDDASRHPARVGDPLGEDLDLGKPLRSATGGNFAAESP